MNWINVKDRLPEPYKDVLLIFDLRLRFENINIIDSPKVITGFYRNDTNDFILNDLDEYDYNIPIREITYWDELPELPED